MTSRRRKVIEGALAGSLISGVLHSSQLLNMLEKKGDLRRWEEGQMSDDEKKQFVLDVILGVTQYLVSGATLGGTGAYIATRSKKISNPKVDSGLKKSKKKAKKSLQ